MNHTTHAVKPLKKKTAGFVPHNWITERPLGNCPVYRPTTILIRYSSSHQVGNLLTRETCSTKCTSLDKLHGEALSDITTTIKLISIPTPGQDQSFVSRSRATTCESWGYTMWKMTGSNWVGCIAALNRTENPGGDESFEGIYRLMGNADAPTKDPECSQVDFVNIQSRPGHIDKRHDEMDSFCSTPLLKRLGVAREQGQRRYFVCLLVGNQKHDRKQVPSLVLAFNSLSIHIQELITLSNFSPKEENFL